MKVKEKINNVVFISLAVLVVSYFLFEKNSDLVSITSLSFTILQTLATVATLAIAILLYDRFGLTSKLMEKQTEKVLELIDVLNKLSFVATGVKGGYFIRANRSHIKSINQLLESEEFKIEAEKQFLVLRDEFIDSIKNILALKESYWLPQEIKNKIEFIDILATFKVNRPSKEKFIKLSSRRLTSKKIGDWNTTFPPLIFKEFNNNLSNLVEEIDKWIRKNTDIEINFFNEKDPEFFKNNS